VRDLAGSRFDWEQALRDLSRAIPSDVTLKNLSGDVSTDAGSGGGGSLRGAVAAPAITLTGCTTGQTQVARLMARLHDVDGVTRVSLSKSDNEKVDRNGGATGSDQDEAALRNSAPCGVGKHPSFEIVAFFENSTATATDSSTSAAPAASPTPTATPTATPAGSAASTTTTEGAAK
jgi:Tfp pilus assembly protein PilN